MATLTVEEAQSRLAQIIDALSPGEEIVLTRDDKPVATIRAAPKPEEPTSRQFGTLKGTILHIAPDFDDIPEGFEECLL
jgi:antitoxin (DNA-binding transcriptional repressor) of toxin-antitoxin stability system